MSIPNAFALALAVVVAALLAWHSAASPLYPKGLDRLARIRRFRTGWEVRGMVIVVTVPYAAGMITGYVSSDYLLALLLFAVAGLLTAARIGPVRLSAGR